MSTEEAEGTEQALTRRYGDTDFRILIIAPCPRVSVLILSRALRRLRRPRGATARRLSERREPGGVQGTPPIQYWLVRKGGLEPPRYCYRQPLKLVRLPIPPLSRGLVEVCKLHNTSQLTPLMKYSLTLCQPRRGEN